MALQVISGSKGVMVPTIPPVADLPSAISALSQINSLLPSLAGMGPGANNVYPTTGFGFPQFITTVTLPMTPQSSTQACGPTTTTADPGASIMRGGPRGYGGPRQRWLEKARGTEVVRITDPTDSSQYVDFTRIKFVLFACEKTDIELLWKLRP